MAPGTPLSGASRVSFVMPSEYTLETIPQPMDERISILFQTILYVIKYT
jgi:hypothetical protein